MADLSRAVAACLLFLVVAFQVRISLDTVHRERNLDFFVPFLPGPFSNRVNARDYHSGHEVGARDSESGVRFGDYVLSVNGKPFRGMSVYLRELWPERPFLVTVRSLDSRIRQIEITFPHCTCGIPSQFEATAFWVVPQLFCILLGFGVVWLRPRAVFAWCFLALTLSLSQLQFWPDSLGFQQTATPMVWADWWRVPGVGYQAFVQHIWPAALLILCAQFYRASRNAYRLTLVLAAVFMAFAAVEAILAIAWSEDFQSFAALFRVLEEYRAELMVLSAGAIAVIAWLVNHRLGMAIATLALGVAIALYWAPPPIRGGAWNEYAGEVLRFDPGMPEIHNTPGLILLVFVCGCLLVGLMAAGRLMAAGLFFLVPLAVHVGGTLGAYWYAFDGPQYQYWPWFVLAASGVGLLCIAHALTGRGALGSAAGAPADRLNRSDYKPEAEGSAHQQ